MKCLRSFFSFTHSGDFPDVPEEEPLDPSLNRELSDAYRIARRNLMVLCAVSLAWSTAQFSSSDLKVNLAGISADLSAASLPLIFGAAIIYLLIRFTLEFSMMSRHTRRWRIAQLDYKIVLNISKFTILTLSTATMTRSLYLVLGIMTTIGILALVSVILSALLMFITMPIRMWARKRADRISAANSAIEALAWAGLFAVILTILGVILFACVISYSPHLLVPLGVQVPPPMYLSIFILTLIVIFSSHWLLNPLLGRIFSSPPGYTTSRDENGKQTITISRPVKEPLL